MKFDEYKFTKKLREENDEVRSGKKRRGRGSRLVSKLGSVFRVRLLLG